MAETSSRIGPYLIESELGRGGMGVVYLSRDPKLGRAVAIKVLPDEFSRDPERLARFDREAKLLASLSHANIAGIYGLEDDDGRRFLVLEYIEGPTLADRLQRGALSIEDTVDVCRQIAAALESAHEAGIIHRDLKPGNVKITPGGDVKVLDFGLARGPDAAGSSTSLHLSNSPTLAFAPTGVGVILGTAAYMSPEQARGKPVDRRTDIWSFGCVLFECLTGRQAFEGETVSDTIAMILQGAPEWNALPAKTPERLRELLQRCLEKDPKKRLRDIGDARVELEAQASGAASQLRAASTLSGDAPAASPAASRRPWLWALAGAAVVALLFCGWMLLRPAPRPAPVRFVIPMPEGVSEIGTPKISPDGRIVAFDAVDTAGIWRIWVRPMEDVNAKALDGTEGTGRVFWSPDSKYIGFLQSGKLMRVSALGGPVQTMADARSRGDGSWGARGDVLYDGNANDSVRIVPGGTGVPGPATVIARSIGEVGSAWPSFLPDGRHFLFLGLRTQGDSSNLRIGEVGKLDSRMLATGPFSRVEYSQGYVLYVRDKALLAQKFDAGSQKFTGQPYPIVDDVNSGATGAFNADFSVSQNGVLVWRGGGTTQKIGVQWVDRAGRELERLGEPGDYSNLMIAPDGQQVSVDLGIEFSNIWVLDRTRGTKTRLTFTTKFDYAEVWSPDGRQMVFASNRTGGSFGLYGRASQGVGTDSLWLAQKYDIVPRSWSPDGREIYCLVGTSDGGSDIYAVAAAGRHEMRPVLITPQNERDAQVSPDGRWVAYVTRESGRLEVYVTSSQGSGKWQVSAAGGAEPRWSRDGKEIFFVTSDGRLMSVPVEGGSDLKLGVPHALFSGIHADRDGYRGDFAVAPDGQHFAVLMAISDRGRPAATVLMNWLQK